MISSDEITALLISYARGALKGKRKREVESMLASDTDAAEALKIIRDMLSLQREQRSPTGKAMQSLSERMFKDFVADRGSRTRRIGITVFDSRDLPLPSGVRPATVETRKLRYKLGSWDIHLSLYPVTPESYELIGRLSGEDVDSSLKIRVHHRDGAETVSPDANLVFRFARIPADDCNIDVKRGSKVLGTILLELC